LPEQNKPLIQKQAFLTVSEWLVFLINIDSFAVHPYANVDGHFLLMLQLIIKG
jgi:hypothetical protein